MEDRSVVVLQRIVNFFGVGVFIFQQDRTHSNELHLVLFSYGNRAIPGCFGSEDQPTRVAKPIDEHQYRHENDEDARNQFSSALVALPGP